MTSLVVGIDSAKDRVDMVFLLNGEVYHFRSIDAPKVVRTRAESLQFLRSTTKAVIDMITLEVAHESNDAVEAVIFVEAAISVRSIRVAIHLAQTVGMLLALPHRVYEVPIDSWKQVLTGKGGVSKDEVKAAVTKRFPQASQFNRQDLFDAAGVAFYGDTILRREL